MTPLNAFELSFAGLWKNNPAFVQLLGLCPLLATSNTLVNGLSMGLATTFVLILSTTLVSLCRVFLPAAIRLPMFMLIIAGSVTLVEVVMQAWFYTLYLSLGIFIPLIVTNCIIVGRAEAFASRHNTLASLWDGLMMGLGFLWVLTLLGAIREYLSKGTLFSGLDDLLGASFKDASLQLAEPNMLLIAVFPAGAFIIFGCLLALKNAIDARTTTAQEHLDKTSHPKQSAQS